MLDAKQVKKTEPLWQLANRFGFAFRHGYGNNCPFCGKPKLTVNDYTYYCFVAGCKGKCKGGDIYRLLIDTGKASSFKEALEKVKNELNLTQNNSEFVSKIKTRARGLEEIFSVYNKRADQETYRYLLERGFQNVLEIIPIGAADERWFLRSRGFSQQEIDQAGLLSDSGNELFFNHIIFPVYNRYNELVHLQGRNLNGEPRWINTKAEQGYTISRYLFNENNFCTSEGYLSEGITDGLSLIELVGADKVVSCFGVNPKLDPNLFRGMAKLYAVFDNDRIEQGKEDAGALKSWSSILSELIALKTALPELEIECIMPPDRPFLCDINDWFRQESLSEALLRQQAVPLWEFLFREFPDDPRFHGQLLRYLSSVEDPELYRQLEENISSRTSTVEYLLQLLERRAIYVSW